MQWERETNRIPVEQRPPEVHVKLTCTRRRVARGRLISIAGRWIRSPSDSVRTCAGSEEWWDHPPLKAQVAVSHADNHHFHLPTFLSVLVCPLVIGVAGSSPAAAVAFAAANHACDWSLVAQIHVLDIPCRPDYLSHKPRSYSESREHLKPVLRQFEPIWKAA
jgi:hypothetical protein